MQCHIWCKQTWEQSGRELGVSTSVLDSLLCPVTGFASINRAVKLGGWLWDTAQEPAPPPQGIGQTMGTVSPWSPGRD